MLVFLICFFTGSRDPFPSILRVVKHRGNGAVRFGVTTIAVSCLPFRYPYYGIGWHGGGSDKANKYRANIGSDSPHTPNRVVYCFIYCRVLQLTHRRLGPVGSESVRANISNWIIWKHFWVWMTQLRRYFISLHCVRASNECGIWCVFWQPMYLSECFVSVILAILPARFESTALRDDWNMGAMLEWELYKWMLVYIERSHWFMIYCT